jgi:hypothetical protein
MGRLGGWSDVLFFGFSSGGFGDKVFSNRPQSEWLWTTSLEAYPVSFGDMGRRREDHH